MPNFLRWWPLIVTTEKSRGDRGQQGTAGRVRTRRSGRWLKRRWSNSTRGKSELEGDIKLLLLPKDPNDDGTSSWKSVPGTGGDESALFAGRPFPDVLPFCRIQPLEEWK